jgi:hypothetical protein
MRSNPRLQAELSSKAIAQRLRAHARLCEQIASQCSNEATAITLYRMAHDCTQVADELMTDHRDIAPQTRH